jgi:hypothetical protein
MACAKKTATGPAPNPDDFVLATLGEAAEQAHSELAMLAQLRGQGMKPLLPAPDPTLDKPVCRMNSLDDADGWADLLDTVQGHPEHTVVINAAARTKASTANYGEIMQGALRELQRELIVFWIINRHRDSIELLHSFQQAFPDVTIHVCRNLYFGDSERFDLFNNSKARETIEKTGRTLDFPAVANRVADWLYSKRMSIRAAYPEMPFGTRAELQRWRARCAEMFDLVSGEKA